MRTDVRHDACCDFPSRLDVNVEVVDEEQSLLGVVQDLELVLLDVLEQFDDVGEFFVSLDVEADGLHTAGLELLLRLQLEEV